MIGFGLFALAACEDGDGGGGGAGQVTIRYSGDDQVRGILIRTEGNVAGNATGEEPSPCVAAEELATCDVQTTVSGGDLTFHVRECVIEEGTDLFHCSLSPAQADALESAVVTAPCRCQTPCPEPAIALCEGDDCVNVEGLTASAPAAAAATSVRGPDDTGGITGDSICPTCCEQDFADELTARLTADSTLTQIELEFETYECTNWECDRAFDGPDVVVFDELAPDRVSVCVASEYGFGNDIVSRNLFACLNHATNSSTLEVKRALDRNYEPTASLPDVEMPQK